MFLLLHFFIFYNLIIWKPCGSQYLPGTSSRMIQKIIKLAEEVTIDAVTKIDSIQHLNIAPGKSTAFQYGHLTYRIRYRYKRMILLYRKAIAKIEAGEQDPDQHVDKLVEMDSLAHDIINLIEMIQLNEEKKTKNGKGGGGQMRLLRTNEATLWQHLVDSQDSNYPPKPPSEANIKTHTGKRKNGLWHYAVPIQ